MFLCGRRGLGQAPMSLEAARQIAEKLYYERFGTLPRQAYNWWVQKLSEGAITPEDVWRLLNMEPEARKAEIEAIRQQLTPAAVTLPHIPLRARYVPTSTATGVIVPGDTSGGLLDTIPTEQRGNIALAVLGAAALWVMFGSRRNPFPMGWRFGRPKPQRRREELITPRIAGFVRG